MDMSKCKGMSRYNNGQYADCDRNADKASGLCPIHTEVRRTDPLGSSGWVNPQGA